MTDRLSGRLNQIVVEEAGSGAAIDTNQASADIGYFESKLEEFK